MRIEKGETIAPGLAAMNDHGAAHAARQLELFGEDALLNVARRMVVVIIETDFPPGKEFGALRQIAEFVVMCRCGELGFMRVNSGGGINPFVALAKWQRGVQRAGSAADGEDVAYSSSLRPRQHIGSIGIEFGHIHVRMRID